MVGIYALLDQTAPRLLAAPMLVVGLAVALSGLVLSGRRVERTRYRPDRWRVAEISVVLLGLGVAVTGWWVNRAQVAIAYPDLVSAPQLSLQALAAGLLGVLVVVVTPPPAGAVPQRAVPVAAGRSAS